MITRWLTSVLSSSFEALEANKRREFLLAASLVGSLGTIAIWIYHLRHPWLFDKMLHLEIAKILLMVIGFAPPFAAAHCIGRLLFFRINVSNEHASGPMSGYIYRDEEGKKWRLAVVAAMIGVVNFLLMMITSQPR